MSIICRPTKSIPAFAIDIVHALTYRTLTLIVCTQIRGFAPITNAGIKTKPLLPFGPWTENSNHPLGADRRTNESAAQNTSTAVFPGSVKPDEQK